MTSSSKLTAPPVILRCIVTRVFCVPARAQRHTRSTQWRLRMDRRKRWTLRGQAVGDEFARGPSAMAAGTTVDQEPGPLTEIRADAHSVTFHLTIASARGEAARLIIRCDPNGNGWASIDNGPTHRNG